MQSKWNKAGILARGAPLDCLPNCRRARLMARIQIRRAGDEGSARREISQSTSSPPPAPGAQLPRLVRMLRNADRSSVIVIHHDSFQSRLDEELFDAIPDVHILTGDEPIVWGDLTLESARWRFFRWILDSPLRPTG